MITFNQIDNIAQYEPGARFIDPVAAKTRQYVRTIVPLTAGDTFTVTTTGLIQVSVEGTHLTLLDVPSDNYFWAVEKPIISLGDINGFSDNVEYTGIHGIDNGHLFLWNKPTSFDPVATLRIDRHADFGTGVTGNTYKALWVATSSGPANAGYEWGICSQMENTANVSTESQNVAINATVFKVTPTNTAVTTSTGSIGSIATVTFDNNNVIPIGHSVVVSGVTPLAYNGTWVVTASSAGSVSFASTATGAQSVAGTIVDTSVGHTWASNFNAVDATTENNPIGTTIGCEIDCNANYATTDNNKNRVGLQIACGAVPGAHVSRAVLIGTNGGATIDWAIDFNGQYQYGIDFSKGSFSEPCIMLGPSQSVAFDATTSGTYTCKLSYSNSSNTLNYNTSHGTVFSISNTGTLNFANNLLLNNECKLGVDSNSSGAFERYINWVTGSLQYVTPFGQAMSINDAGSMYLAGDLSTAGHVITGNLEVNGFSQRSVLTGLTSTGTDQSTAITIPKMINEFTNVAAGTGTILLSLVGVTVTIINYGNNPLLVYPNLGAQINRSGINTPLSIPVNTIVNLICTSATQWYH